MTSKINIDYESLQDAFRARDDPNWGDEVKLVAQEWSKQNVGRSWSVENICVQQDNYYGNVLWYMLDRWEVCAKTVAPRVSDAFDTPAKEFKTARDRGVLVNVVNSVSQQALTGVFVSILLDSSNLSAGARSSWSSLGGALDVGPKKDANASLHSKLGDKRHRYRYRHSQGVPVHDAQSKKFIHTDVSGLMQNQGSVHMRRPLLEASAHRRRVGQDLPEPAHRPKM